MPRARSLRPAEHVDIPSLLPPFAPRNETERWLFELQRRGIRPGLSGIRRLLHALGDPQEQMASVIVAGTNGKGTMAICLAALCRAAGLRTALYTSPHLLQVGERLVVDGEPIPAAVLRDLVTPHRARIDELQTTFFESLTALALRHFADEHVDVAILEAGLGGRLDATNAVPRRGVVLTSVGLDHQELLGDSLEEIAVEKLGLAAAGVPFYLPELPAALDRLATDHLRRADAVRVSLPELLRRQPVDAPAGRPEFSGPLQRAQIAAALAVYRDLAQRNGWPATDPYRALHRLRAPARFERYGTNPEVVVDTAHNEPALTSLLEHWSSEGERAQRVLVLGVMRDKTVEAALPRAVEAAASIVVTAPHWYRAVAPEELAPRIEAAAAAAGRATQILVEPSVRRALEVARRRAGLLRGRVLITGSNFLVAEALDRMGIDDLRQAPHSNLWSTGQPLRARTRQGVTPQ